MAINDTEELTVTSSYGGQLIVNTYHFRVADITLPAGLTIEQALIDAWQAACYTQYRALTPIHSTIVAISARQVCGTLPLRARVDENVNTTGAYSNTGEAAAPWLAALVRESTGLAGRSRVGRNFYLVGFESDFIGTALHTAFLTPINAYNTALMGAFGPAGTSGDFDLVVHSHKLASVPGTQCQNSSTPVTALSTSPFLTTMRSRRSRSGV